MSGLVKDLFYTFILFILLIKSLEFLMYEVLIVSKREDNMLVKDFMKLLGAFPAPEMCSYVFFHLKCTIILSL